MAQIRNSIFAGELKPGQRLDQERLSQELGISKIPLREALISLEATGLIVNIPRRGSYIAELERNDIRDTFRLFGAVSAMTAQQAAAERSVDVVASLRLLLEEMETEGDAAAFAILNDRFHALIHSHGSRRLRSVLRNLADGLPERFFEPAQGWHADAHKEHVEMVLAIESGDEGLAHDRTQSHFNRNGELAVRLLEERGFWTANSIEERNAVS